MGKSLPVLLGMAIALVVGFVLGGRMMPAAGTAATAAGFAAVPGAVGSQDNSGPYDVVRGWPKDIGTLPGNEKWTWGSGQGVFAESPNRVYLLMRGMLPATTGYQFRTVPEVGPGVHVPINGAYRDATSASIPGAGGMGQEPEDGPMLWRGARPPYRQIGVDAKWENILVIVDANGNIVERWNQWDSMFVRPHVIYVNPYDPDKHVWVIDDHKHVIYKFSHDGKTIVQTIGTPGVKGADATHFNRPTFIGWLPDSTMFVSDGYNGNRVVKLDKDGKFLLAWGEKGTPPNESRPNYMNNVHGIAVDPQAQEVYVNDRANHRIQVFDVNGKYLREWKITEDPSQIYVLYMGADRKLWTGDGTNSKVASFDPQGHLLYAWGNRGIAPGNLWGIHGFHVDQEGNLYISEVNAGRVQKFRPRPGANPDLLVSKPVYSAWQ